MLFMFLLATGILTIAAGHCPADSADGGFTKVREELNSRLADRDQLIAVAYKNLNTGKTLFVNEKTSMHAASLMKVPVMIEVYKQAQAGIFSMYDLVLVTNDFKSIVDSSSFSLKYGANKQKSVYKKLGQKMSFRDLVYYMITESSNLAANILIDIVGTKNVMNTMKSIHADDIRILRGVEDLKAYQLGLNNTTTAFDMLLIMEAIARQKVVSPEACEDMLGILSNQKNKTKIPALLPGATKVAHKTGSVTAIDHDAAIINHSNGQRYVLIIMTRGFDHSEAGKHIAEISRYVFDSVK